MFDRALTRSRALAQREPMYGQSKKVFKDSDEEFLRNTDASAHIEYVQNAIRNPRQEEALHADLLEQKAQRQAGIEVLNESMGEHYEPLTNRAWVVHNVNEMTQPAVDGARALYTLPGRAMDATADLFARVTKNGIFPDNVGAPAPSQFEPGGGARVSEIKQGMYQEREALLSQDSDNAHLQRLMKENALLLSFIENISPSGVESLDTSHIPSAWAMDKATGTAKAFMSA
jgi:hypothetical protein